jgi:hypothetical protein
MKDGALLRVDAAVYSRFEDGLITRIEEYAGLPGNDAGRPAAHRSAVAGSDGGPPDSAR